MRHCSAIEGENMRKRLVRLALTTVIAALLAGCAREGIYDLAKYGADVVFGLRNDGISLKLYVANDEYYEQYDTMSGFWPVVMVTNQRGTIFFREVPVGGQVLTHFGGYTSIWGPLLGAPLGVIQSMVDRHDEVLVIDDTPFLYRLHEDSWQKTTAYDEITDLTGPLGAFNHAMTIFKAFNTDDIYILSNDGFTAMAFFRVSEGGVYPVVYPDSGTFPLLGGTIVFSGRRGNYFYLCNNNGAIYKMSVSVPTDGQTYGPFGMVSSAALTDSGTYYLMFTLDASLMSLNESTGASTLVKTFVGATAGSIWAFDRENLAINIFDGAEPGVWLWKDGKFKRIINIGCNAVYVP